MSTVKKLKKISKTKIGNAGASSMVQYADQGTFFRPTSKTKGRLPSGIYEIGVDMQGPFFSQQNINTDEWIDFRDDVIINIMKEIDDFWARKEIFEQYGFLQRRGYMFYGPPGSGKSVLLKQIMSRIIEEDGVVFKGNVHPNHIISCIGAFRDLEPERKIVVIFEDLDSLISAYGEASMLSYFDGEDSNNYILNLATTNYPERLDRRITQRPRRFDRLIEIGPPDQKMRYYYFINKLNITEEEASEWVRVSEGFSFAGLTELVISVKCLGHDLYETAKRLDALFNIKIHSDIYREKMDPLASVGLLIEKLGELAINNANSVKPKKLEFYGTSEDTLDTFIPVKTTSYIGNPPEVETYSKLGIVRSGLAIISDVPDYTMPPMVYDPSEIDESEGPAVSLNELACGNQCCNGA